MGVGLAVRWVEPLRRRRVAAYIAGPGLDDALDVCRRLRAGGLACVVGYSASPDDSPRAVADAHLAAFGADLPEQPRLAERPIGAEKVVVERSDPLGDRPVEAPDLLDLRHSLTLVR